MRKIFYLLFLCGIVGCVNPTMETEAKEEGIRKEIMKASFQAIIDSSQLTGTTLIFDPQKGEYYSNDFERARKGNLPASTFKIPNSIIALEVGVVKDDSTLFKWDGQKRRLPIWEQDMIFREAFHRSCVPCYQEVARKVGVERMQEYLRKLNYGEMAVDSNSIDLFWLEGESRITAFQQIDFLHRFYENRLPITDHTTQIMKRLMVIDDNDRYRISGKTGWSIRNGNDNGWFVGYVEKGNSVYYFATNVEPTAEFNMDDFPAARKEVTMQVLGKMGITR